MTKLTENLVPHRTIAEVIRTGTTDSDIVQLNITARNVDGQIQISYMREPDGLEHNFVEGGDTAFTIRVNLPKEYLTPNIPTVEGVV